MSKKRRRKSVVYDDFILFEPLCDCCRKPIVSVNGFKDVRVKFGASVYDRRHFNWICEPCLRSVLKHSQLVA